MKKHNVITVALDDTWSVDLQEAVEDFVHHRAETKYPLTIYAAKRFNRLINKYRSWKYHDDDIVEAIDRSMRNNWRDVFLEPIPKDQHRERILNANSKYWDLYTDEERNSLLQ